MHAQLGDPADLYLCHGGTRLTEGAPLVLTEKKESVRHALGILVLRCVMVP